jgi:hypothetical protein
MCRQVAVFVSIILPVFLVTNCAVRGLAFGEKPFVAQDGGVILCNPPTGYSEVDLDNNVNRRILPDVNDDPAKYRPGWRNDCIWRLLKQNHLTIEAVSPYSGVVERYDVPELLGKEVVCLDVFGSMSDGRVLAEFDMKDGKHICLLNTLTKKVEEFWKYPDAEPMDFVISPYGDFVTIPAYSKKTENQSVWVYDCRQNKFSNLTEHLQLPPEVLPVTKFEDAQVSPDTNIVVLPEQRIETHENGLQSLHSRIWVYDPQTRNVHKVTFGQRESFELLQGYIFAPDGKRMIVDGFGDCFIYDVSSQIIAQVPKNRQDEIVSLLVAQWALYGLLPWGAERSGC